MYAETKDNAISALKRPSLKGMQTPSDGASVDVDFTVPSAASNSNGPGGNEKRSEGFVKSIRRWFHNADLGQSLFDIFMCRCASCNPFSRKRNVGTQYRTIIPNHMLSKDSGPKHHPNRKYAGNKIKTTKYTLFTFLPKNLFEQFHRFANLYFVFVVLLNWFPQIEAFGKELAMIPVVFVLAVTAFKDLYEDRRRYRSDQKINHSVCRVFSTTEGRYVPTEWYNLIVGDIIHLSCNEIIPADVLLLRSSDPLGVCFVETSNLDGESNLKQRQIVSGLHDAQAHFKPTDFCSTIQCELPNNQIYRYNGFLLLPNGSREAVNKNNLLLRGCEIRNTDFVEGIVIYAGHETKAMLNNSGPRYKRTKLERMMNWDIVWCVVILLVLCFIGAVGSGIWLSSFEDLSGIVYLPHLHPNVSENRTFTTTPELEGFIVFWSYIIILQVMIPISLYVSIEIVKLGQVFFITQDRQLYHAASNKRIQCRALNIPEELGQIQYVMSDKTGTLTENQMIFRRCTVAGFDYGPPDVNISRDLSVANLTENAKETSKDVKPNAKLHDYISLISQNLDASASLSSPKRKTIMEFFVNMALCNTVVVNPHPHKDSMNANGLVSSTPGGDSTPSTTNTLMREIYPTTVLYGQPQSDYSTHSTPALPSRPMKNGLLPIINNPLPKVQSTENLFYVPPPSNNVSLPPLHDHSKNIPEIRTNLARRMSVSVPDLIGPDDDQNSVKNKHLSVGTDVGHQLFESTPELTESKEGEHTENGKLPNAHSLQWFPRPKTLNLNLHFSRFLELPRLAMQKFPLSRRSLLAPSISPGYKSPFYEAESPDELALVYASSAYGIRLVKRQGNFVTLEMPTGYLERYEVLYTLPFDSVRKRMSVVIRNPKTLQIVLFTKGADTAIMDILSDAFKESELGQTYLFKAQEYLNDYASKGYRTLCLAKRELSDEIFAKWVVQHIEAEMAIDDREQLIFESALRIEEELELLGITGIEDRLQDGVADCIKSLRQGGIRVWVLTGDKIETAVNIAYACELFVYGMDLIQLSARNEEDTSTLLDHHLNQLANRATNADDENVLPDKSESIGLVVDGRTLAYCLLPKMEDKFVQIVSRCTSVLCCRTSPLQKASVVRLVKDKLEGLTLAIGDGANDVSMIQCADVGVGISGQEGMQAVMASDFAMARFKFLKRLLLVHGHWCYDRLARMVCYFFYKNALFVFTLVWFQVWNGFSAQVMIDPLYLMLYNLVFTSLPPLLMGVFDQDAPDDLLMEKEILYAQGPKGLLYKSHSFWVNMLDALWQSVVIFFVPLFLFIDTDMTMWSFGFIITACLVVVNQCHLSMEVKSWTLPMLVSILLSVGVFVTFALCYNLLSITCCGNDPPYWVAERFMLQPIFWLCLLFVVVLSLLPRFTFRVWYNTVYPSDVLQACIDLREKQEKLKRNRTTVFNNLIARWITNERHVSFIQSGNAER